MPETAAQLMPEGAGDRPARGAPAPGTVLLAHNTTKYLHLHYQELIQELLDRGWRVKCMAPRDSATGVLESQGVGCLDITISRRGMNPLLEIRCLLRFYRVLRRERPDVVLNFTIKPVIYGSLAAKLAGVGRTASMITGLGYVFLGRSLRARVLSGVVGRVYRAALTGNHRVFFQNPDDRDFFRRRGIVAHGQCVVLNGTGIDTDRFAPRPQTRPSSGVRFLMVARLLYDKGVREYVSAARGLRARDPGVRCALLGPCDDNPSAVGAGALQAWSQEGCVEFLGETADVASVLADCDVFVLPSYREGLPRATLEAMAMGKPVITTDVPGCRETVVDGRNGYLVPAGDAAALQAAMARLVADPALIKEMGRASRQMAVRHYDVRAVNREIVRNMTDAAADA